MQIIKTNTAKPVQTKLFIGEYLNSKSRKVKIVTLEEGDLAKVKAWVETQLSNVTITKDISVLEKPVASGYVMMRNQQGGKVIGKSISLTTYYLDLPTAYKAITGEELEIKEVVEESDENAGEISMTEKESEKEQSIM